MSNSKNQTIGGGVTAPISQYYSTGKAYNEHGACGVGITVPLGQFGKDGKRIQPDRAILENGLQRLAGVEYRAGFNETTEESDGSGIRIIGLPTKFFQKLIQHKGIKLEDGKFVVGQYLFPKIDGKEVSKEQIEKTKKLIEETAEKDGLKVVGWRCLDDNVDQDTISPSAWAKKPSQYQAILVAENAETTHDQLEAIALKSAISITNAARGEEKTTPVYINSQSSESIVYKGLVLPSKLSIFFKDLQDPDFTAFATQIHARFSTNTSSTWQGAQPCFLGVGHNGELNSVPTACKEMVEETRSKQMHAMAPDMSRSDSIRFDTDLANQIANGLSLEEAWMLLMPQHISDDDKTHSPEIKAMLKYFSTIRTPYNGPAFMTGYYNGEFMCRLDSVGLRPSRYAIVEDEKGNRTFHAYSDDELVGIPRERITKSGDLESGGAILITKNGEILRTEQVLERVRQKFIARLKKEATSKKPELEIKEPGNNDSDFFTKLMQEKVINLDDFKATAPLEHKDQTSPTLPKPANENTASTQEESKSLHKQLEASFVDADSEKYVLRYMALTGAEKVGAMGNDTSLLPSLTKGLPFHMAYLFHQLFQQVSAPPLDSIREKESFTLETYLGASSNANVEQSKVIGIKSPILAEGDLQKIEKQNAVHKTILDITFQRPEINEDGSLKSGSPEDNMKAALKVLLEQAEQAAKTGGIIILSDKESNQNKIAIPDVIAVAAIRKHLESKGLSQNVSIVCDSMQVMGPHHASVLFSLGARALYARGAYRKIEEFAETDPDFTTKGKQHHYEQFQHGMEKSLLKVMGKMGITHFNNYCNGGFIASIGLNFSDDNNSNIAENPSLANIFGGLYSPFKGLNLSHIASHVIGQHIYAYEKENPAFKLNGHFRPESGGVKHGFGPEVVNAFTDWMKAEKINRTLKRVDDILKEKGIHNFLTEEQRADFTPEKGFLDSDKKEKGFYKKEDLESFKQSEAFIKMCKTIQEYQQNNPTSISDFLTFTPAATQGKIDRTQIQTVQDILGSIFSGSMSQGALTAGDPFKPGDIKAHETITRAMNAIGAKSSAGEGGEGDKDLENPQSSAYNKQVASGRFGVYIKQLMNAGEIEIKVAQGAKPGEGGQLSGAKISIRFAAQRGAIPGTELISPPPHHDIYSIEDLAGLIYALKSANPKANVAVKLVASEGIGTIATGVAKAGADVINIAGNSGGTGAANISSIKNAGLPAELGLVEVHKALQQSGLRDKVKLKTSGGFKTPIDVIKAAILGADLFEFGTTAMLTLGCKMQRTCNKSCEPGVATDGEKFKGEQIVTESYFLNIAYGVQAWLIEHGFASLNEIRGRVDLLKVANEEIAKLFDFSAILGKQNQETKLVESKETFEAKHLESKEKKDNLHPRKDDDIIKEIRTSIENIDKTQQNQNHPISNYYENKNIIELTGKDRAFGARIAGKFYKKLAENNKNITLHTSGSAGQYYGFVNTKGMILDHTGPVQDAAGECMSGGEVIIKTPYVEGYRADENTIAGNVAFMGARGGKGFINGRVGHRLGTVNHGAQIVVEGARDYACEDMTSGTVMILGETGNGLGAGAAGGIIFAYDKDNKLKEDSKDEKGETKKGTLNESVRLSHKDTETPLYQNAIKQMLKEHFVRTGSQKAQEILAELDKGTNKFKILIPKELDKVTTLKQVTDVFKTYSLRESNICVGMQVWLEHRAEIALSALNLKNPENNPFTEQDKTELQDFIATIENIAKDHPHKIPLKKEFIEETLKSANEFLDKCPKPKVEVKVADIEQLIPHPSPTTSISSEVVLVEPSPTNPSPGTPYVLIHPKGGKPPIHRSASALNLGEVKTGALQHFTNEPPSGITRPHTEGSATEGKESNKRKSEVKLPTEVTKRISSITGIQDYEFTDVLKDLSKYVKELKTDAEGCSSCEAQSCAGVSVVTGCAEEKPINSINAALKTLGIIGEHLTVAQWKTLREAFELQISKTPFIAFTGAACPAPCESACTETIPDATGQVDSKRGNKQRGEAVHIKDIELLLYLIGWKMGWFEERPKEFSDEEKSKLFEHNTRFNLYKAAIEKFKPAFTRKLPQEIQESKEQKQEVKQLANQKEVIIIGSGPAAMEIAYRALRDGVKVRMYEKSDKPGGLLMDGIPTHKFPKEMVDWHFEQLKHMGLKLHLNSEVTFENGAFRIAGKDGDDGFIAQASDTNKQIVLCTGAGKPKELPKEVTEGLKDESKEKIVQAVYFLKAANDIASELQKLKQTISEESDEFKQKADTLIKQKLGKMDPRGKELVIIGGGDTAQDAIRWAIKYLKTFEAPAQIPENTSVTAETKETKKPNLSILVRGTEQSTERGLSDSHPRQSQTPSKENKLKDEEIKEIGAKQEFLAEPTKISPTSENRLKIDIQHSELNAYKEIKEDKELKKLYDSLPREKKPKTKTNKSTIEADMVICALGFEPGNSNPLISKTSGHQNIHIAGDAADSQDWIIVGAQKSGGDTYENKVKEALGIQTKETGFFVTNFTKCGDSITSSVKNRR